MEKIRVLFVGVLLLIIIASAIYAVFSTKLKSSVLAAGIISMFASIIFLMLASPDVAMTEAAIGAGLTTFLFFVIIRKIEKQNDSK